MVLLQSIYLSQLRWSYITKNTVFQTINKGHNSKKVETDDEVFIFKFVFKKYNNEALASVAQFIEH